MRTNTQLDCADSRRTPMGAGDKCFLLAFSVVFGALTLWPVWSIIAWLWLRVY